MSSERVFLAGLGRAAPMAASLGVGGAGCLRLAHYYYADPRYYYDPHALAACFVCGLVGFGVLTWLLLEQASLLNRHAAAQREYHWGLLGSLLERLGGPPPS
jgi:hypothetical protein